MPVLKERRFRDMRLTEEDALDRAQAFWPKRNWDGDAWVRYEQRCMSLLPLWREWAIERERLWFALIGLGLDIEGDDRDMPRAEMRKRIGRRENDSEHTRFVLRELAK